MRDMRKVIRLSKRDYSKYIKNNLSTIDDKLAIAEGMAVFNKIPRRRQLRQHFIDLSKQKSGCPFPISHKDIRRLERPAKCEIPVNIVDILELLVEDLKFYKDKFTYRADATDSSIVSIHILRNTIEQIRVFYQWLKGHMDNPSFENNKYRQEVNYVVKRLREFDSKYPGLFNSLFEDGG